ncbi:GTP cyclohydrolase 1 [Ascosphaera pollenicola]|nr:GTP cyclohydrolase 1 [Ascosphaera pollenicola]
MGVEESQQRMQQPPKAASAVPSYMLNGKSSVRRPSSPRERQSLETSIRNSFDRRPLIDEDSQAISARTPILDSSNDRNAPDTSLLDSKIEEGQELSNENLPPASQGLVSDGRVPKPEARELEQTRYLSRRTSATITRPASPYTLNPPVDFDGLSWPCIGTRERLDSTPEEQEKRIDKLSGAVRTILECLGEDPDREGLSGTPERYAKALMFLTKGYEENVRDMVNGAVFHEDHDELVIVKDIEVYSLCEHHLVPFIGKMHIGYIPDGRVIGLSKLARLAEMFSRRLQVQERLTKQVALAIAEVLKPQGVAVVMESSHLCMVMRGVQKAASTTTTSCMLGCMRSSAKTREEFLTLLNRNR